MIVKLAAGAVVAVLGYGLYLAIYAADALSGNV